MKMMSTTFLVIVIAASTVAGPQEVHKYTELPGFLEILQAALASAKSILDAIKDFEDFIEQEAGKHRAVAYIEVQNYADVTMNAGSFLIGLGETDDMPKLISPGTREAFTIQQNEPFTGVEVVAHWKITQSFHAAIIVNAYQQAAWRPANQLGVCIKAGETTPNDYDTWKASSCLSRRDFDTKLENIQCCNDDYCLQGIMSSSHHTNVTIRFLPKDARHLADPSYRRASYQNDLDNILDVVQSCNNDAAVAVLNYMIGSLALITTLLMRLQM